ATTLAFSNGVSSAGGSMTLTKSVGQTITATASSPSVTTPSGLAMTVAAAAASTFAIVDPQSGSIGAGQPHQLTVTAKDAYGNTATGYTGTVVFSSDDAAAGLPSNYAFAGGDNGVHDFAGAATVTLKTAGSRHVTATDAALAVPSASSAAITVDAAAADRFVWAGTPGSATAGAPFSLTLRVEDQFGNAAAGYTGTVAFSSTDGQAVVPGSYSFTGGDAGIHAFTNGF